MTETLSYDEIDPTLTSWAARHALTWSTDCQDTEVRTFYINGDDHRVQVAVDQPTEDAVVLRIGRSGPGKNRSFLAELKCRRGELGKTLDVALETARVWSK